jgi:hypothetical protein
MVVGDTFSDSNGSATFSSRVAIDSVKAVILNIEPRVVSDVCLKTGPYLYVSLAAVYQMFTLLGLSTLIRVAVWFALFMMYQYVRLRSTR